LSSPTHRRNLCPSPKTLPQETSNRRKLRTALRLPPTLAFLPTRLEGADIPVILCYPKRKLADFYSPSGYHQLYANAEGYAVCDYDYNYSYYDWGQYGDSGNWQNATISQPNGANTFPLTIKRTTSDGNWTLTQVFSRNATTPSVTVKMTLRNSSGVARTAYFMRFADIDADNRTTNEFEGGMASIWGYQSGSTGLMMRESWTYSMGAWVLSSLPGNPCSLQHEGIPYLGDAKGMATWFHGLAANSSMTVSVEYRPIN
jgi:hypothetical protein